MNRYTFKAEHDFRLSPFTGITRQHYSEVVQTLLQGIFNHASPGKARIKITGRVSTHGLIADELEGFSRSFIAAAPWLNTSAKNNILIDNQEVDVATFYKSGLLAGTDPEHVDYWGEIEDNSQIIAECASLAWGIYLSKQQIWDKLCAAEKEQIFNYLSKCNAVKVYQNNWLFFQIIINTVFKKLGLAYSSKKIYENLDICGSMYLGEGWYQDGKENRVDYYNAWSFHFYFLIWTLLDGENFPELAQVHVERFRSFMRGFRFFFSTEGTPPCFGRSATYRFAYLAPISLGLIMNCLEQDLGEIKHIYNASLKFFFSNEILSDDGLLLPGFFRHTPNILEPYSCLASSYWLCKAFNILLLSESHPFWSTEEKPLASQQGDFSIPIRSPGFLLFGNQTGDHIQLVNQGFYHDLPFNEKYTKFAFSNLFPHEIGAEKGKYSLDTALCDNSLTFSTGKRYVQRTKIHNLYCEKNFAVSRYPLRFFKREATNWLPRMFSCFGWVHTYILLKDDFMVNVHWIKSRKDLKYREGGYPLGFEEGEPEIISVPGAELARKDKRISFIQNLYGYNIQYPAEELRPGQTHSNVRYKHSVVPSLGFDDNSTRNFVLASLVYGKTGNDSVENLAGLVTDFKIQKRLVEIEFYDGEKVVIQMGKVKRINVDLNGTQVSGKVVLARVSKSGNIEQLIR